MPSHYSHYRMGSLALSRLPEDAVDLIKRHRRLYNLGLQGPDPLFYFNPFAKNEIGALGSAIHHQTGKEFFGRACQLLREDNSETERAYIYGMLGHYCLDSVAHPFVHELTDGGTPGHVELEVEFDRYLLEKDGRTPAHSQYLGMNMTITRSESVTAARFLRPVSPEKIRTAVRHMKLCMRLLTAPALRKIAEKVLNGASPKVKEQLMTIGPNPESAEHDEKMLELFHKALDNYPRMLGELLEYMETDTPLGEDFDKIFG